MRKTKSDTLAVQGASDTAKEGRETKGMGEEHEKNKANDPT